MAAAAGDREVRSVELREILADVPRAALLFVALAAAVVASRTWEELSGAFPDLNQFALFALGTLAVVAQILVPAAILRADPDAWTWENRVFLGSVIWVVPTALVSIVRPFVPSDPADSLAAGYALAAEIASLVSYVGPIVIAAGLANRRATDTAWPLALTLPLAVLCAASGMSLFTQAQDTISIYSANAALGGAAMPAAQQARLYLSSLYPLYLIALVAVAWTALRAAVAREVPRVFWVRVTAGFSLLAAAVAWSMLTSVYLHASASHDLAVFLGSTLVQWALALVTLAGSILILAAFAQAQDASPATSQGSPGSS